MDLLFPGRKPKEVLEEGGDDDLDTGDKKDDGDVKGMFDCLNLCIQFWNISTIFHGLLLFQKLPSLFVAS